MAREEIPQHVYAMRCCSLLELKLWPFGKPLTSWPSLQLDALIARSNRGPRSPGSTPRSLRPIPYTFLLAPGPIDDFLDPISDLPPFPTVVSLFHIAEFSDLPEHAMHARRLPAHLSLLRCIESVKEMYGATTFGTRVTFPP